MIAIIQLENLVRNLSLLRAEVINDTNFTLEGFQDSLSSLARAVMGYKIFPDFFLLGPGIVWANTNVSCCT